MDQLIPSLVTLVEAFRDRFRPRVFSTFQTLIAGWIICLGPRTVSEVWQATGLAAKRHHDTVYAVFRSACWEWDDLGMVLATTDRCAKMVKFFGSSDERDRGRDNTIKGEQTDSIRAVGVPRSGRSPTWRLRPGCDKVRPLVSRLRAHASDSGVRS